MQVPTMQKPTVEEMREKYEHRYFALEDEIKDYRGIVGQSMDELAHRLADLLNEIAVDGYRVEEFTHIQDNSLRGLQFIELSDDTWRKAVEENRKREQTARQEPILYANEDDK